MNRISSKRIKMSYGIVLLRGVYKMGIEAFKLIKSFCEGVQGGQFFQKAPPLVAGGKK
jgi:hypothetical protein